MAFTNTACPKCGSKVFDNRIGKRNPKAPDERCSNKDNCDYVKWDKPKGQQASVPQSNGVQGTQSTQKALGPIYAECLDFAKRACVHHFGAEAVPPDVIAMAATLFIAATKTGAPLGKAKAPPAPAPKPVPPPPPPPATEPNFDDFPPGDDEEEFLPF